MALPDVKYLNAENDEKKIQIIVKHKRGASVNGPISDLIDKYKINMFPLKNTTFIVLRNNTIIIKNN